MKNICFVFVYSKNDMIKVIGLEDATESHNDLINNGWVHTQTIDACKWIEFLHNSCNEYKIFNEIESISKIPH